MESSLIPFCFHNKHEIHYHTLSSLPSKCISNAIISHYFHHNHSHPSYYITSFLNECSSLLAGLSSILPPLQPILHRATRSDWSSMVSLTVKSWRPCPSLQGPPCSGICLLHLLNLPTLACDSSHSGLTFIVPKSTNYSPSPGNLYLLFLLT